MSGIVRLKIQAPSVAFTFDKAQLRKTLRAAGAEVAREARAILRAATGTGRLYYGPGGSAGAYRGGYQSGRYRASAAGQAPVKVTGTLANSIKVKAFRSGDGVAVRDNAFYALFLSAGSQGGIGSGKGGERGERNVRRGKAKRLIRVVGVRVLLPRPFLSTALDRRASTLRPRLEAATQAGLKLEKAP